MAMSILIANLVLSYLLLFFYQTSLWSLMETNLSPMTIAVSIIFHLPPTTKKPALPRWFRDQFSRN